MQDSDTMTPADKEAIRFAVSMSIKMMNNLMGQLGFGAGAIYISSMVGNFMHAYVEQGKEDGFLDALHADVLIGLQEHRAKQLMADKPAGHA